MTKGTREDDLARFWALVVRPGPVPEYAPHLGPCSIWIRSPTLEHYGDFGAQGGHWPAHRFAWGVVAGRPFTPGLVLDHLCRVPACVEVEHLDEVTIGENVLRGIGFAAVNAAKTHCPKGHPYEGDNLYRKPSTRYRDCRACAAVRRPVVTVVCPECSAPFTRIASMVALEVKRGVWPRCCSLSCAAIRRHKRARGEI